MRGLTDDFIAIDTNVFGQINSVENNEDLHIHALLSAESESVLLLVDDGGVINDEYRRHLRKSLDGEYEIAGGPAMLELCVLRWMKPRKQKRVTVHADELMIAIKSVVPPTEPIDQIFVYVAFVMNRILVSNDKGHIIGKRNELKSRVREQARGRNLSHADVMCSREAHARLEQE